MVRSLKPHENGVIVAERGGDSFVEAPVRAGLEVLDAARESSQAGRVVDLPSSRSSP